MSIYNILGSTAFKLIAGALAGATVSYGIYRGVQNAKRMIRNEDIANRNTANLKRALANKARMEELAEAAPEFKSIKEKEKGTEVSMSDEEKTSFVDKMHNLSNGIIEKEIIEEMISMVDLSKEEMIDRCKTGYYNSLVAITKTIDSQELMDDTWKILMAKCNNVSDSWYRPSFAELKEGITHEVLFTKKNPPLKTQPVVIEADEIIVS